MHVGIEDADSCGAAIIVHEDHQGVFGDAPLLQLFDDPSDVFVNVVNHSEETLGIFGEAFICVEGFVLGACVVGAVGGVSGNVGEKRFFGFHLRFHPPSCLCVENVCAVTICFLEGSVVEDGGIEIRVCGGVAAGTGIDLSDSSSSVDEYFRESAAVGLVIGFIAEVPLSKNAG